MFLRRLKSLEECHRDLDSDRAFRVLWHGGCRDSAAYKRVFTSFLKSAFTEDGIYSSNGDRVRWRARTPLVIGTTARRRLFVLDAVSLYTYFHFSRDHPHRFKLTVCCGVLDERERQYKPLYGYYLSEPSYREKAPKKDLYLARWEPNKSKYVMTYKQATAARLVRPGCRLADEFGLVIDSIAERYKIALDTSGVREQSRGPSQH